MPTATVVQPEGATAPEVVNVTTILDPRLTGRREPAWRSAQGAFVPARPVSSVSATLRSANLDYTIEKAELRGLLPARDGRAQVEVNLVSEVALLAPDAGKAGSYRHIGTVSKNHPVLQNRDLARILDPLALEFPVDTIGEYNGMFYVALDAGEGTLFDDEYRYYFLLTEHRAKGKALSIAATPVRLRCGNQANVAFDSSVLAVKLPHVGGDDAFRQDVEWYAGIIGRLKEQKAAVEEAMRILRDVPITTADIGRVAERIYPEASIPRELKFLHDFERTGKAVPESLRERAAKADHALSVERETVARLRGNITDLYDSFSQERPDLAGTGYALYQAVIEHEDYRPGKQARTGAAFGVRAETKKAAYRAIIELSRN